MTVPSPIVIRSVQTGMWLDRIRTPRPIFAPSARRYSVYSGDPLNSTSGFAVTSVLTNQKRTYARLQMRICRGFHRPISAHFTRIGKPHMARKINAPTTTDRR
jgi:hypothetical protein